LPIADCRFEITFESRLPFVDLLFLRALEAEIRELAMILLSSTASTSNGSTFWAFKINSIQKAKRRLVSELAEQTASFAFLSHQPS